MKVTLPASTLTNRESALLALAESDDRYRQVSEHIRDVVWLYDVATSQFLYVNSAFEKLCGRPVEDLYRSQESWFQAIHPDDRDEVRRNWSQVNEHFLSWDIEYRFVSAQGELHFVRDRAQGVRTPGQKTIRVVGHIDDITELKAVEQRLRQLTLQIDAAVNHERRSIAEGLHDQVCQTLAAALLQISLLGTSADPATRTASNKARDFVNSAIQSVRTLTFQLVPPSLLKIGHWAALESAITKLETQFQVPVKLIDSAPGTKLPLHTDEMVFHSIRELIINAMKHSKATEIRVQREISNDELTLTVADNGCGTIERNQANSNSLGLLLVEERIRSIGGCLNFQTTPGKGTQIRLKIRLPASTET